MPDMKRCFRCGAENQVGAKICEKCGSDVFYRPVPSYRAKVCVKCQIAYPASDRFCPKCGRELVDCSVPKCVHCGGRILMFCAGCGRKEADAAKKS